MIRNIHNNLFTIKSKLILIIILYAISVSFPAPAHAGTMQWTMVDTPDSTNNVIISPSEINALAIGADGATIYAIDIPHSKVYKSVNGGTHWEDITGYLTSAGAALPVWDITIAPDNPNLVTVVTSVAGLPRNVFISNNGGSNWQNTNCPAANNISAIAVSTNYGNYDIAIGTRTGTGGGNIHIFKTSGTGSWINQNFTGDIMTATFSPTYSSDNSLVIISANGNGTYINLGIRDTVANSTNWSTWSPVEITTSGSGTSPKANQIITADLELPSDFSGQAPSSRRFYISIDAPLNNAGIYRFDDTIGYWLMPSTTNKRISSIAYYGNYNSGKLLAGEVIGDANTAKVMTWFTDAPITCPSTCWYQAIKQPTGGGNSGYANAQIYWSPDGSKAYCCTSSADLDIAGWPNGYLTTQALDESAFSISHNNGETWNQLSLIDTEISFLSDVVASTNSDTIYLASINTNGGLSGFDSLWRSTSYPPGKIWERILCVLTTSDDTIVRLDADGTGHSVFFAVRSTSDMYHSDNKGENWRKLITGTNTTDFTVTEINGIPCIYILENNSLRKGEYKNQTWKWGVKMNTPLNSGHTITATPDGMIVIGDAGEGMVAFSIDAGSEFVRLPPVPVPGNVHVIVDTRIGNFKIIYAASDGIGGQIYGWNTGPSSYWVPMEPSGQNFYGLAQAGTLYGAWSDGASIGVDRTLNPEAGPPYTEWDTLTSGISGGVIFTREPVSLKISNGVDIWAIDNRPYTADTGRLWNYYDCLTGGLRPTMPQPDQGLLSQAPTPNSPALDIMIPVSEDMEFKWQHPTAAISYDLWIAKDKDFKQPLIQKSITPDNIFVPYWLLSSNDSPLIAGDTYYWKVRVNRDATYEKNKGQWSEIMSFSIETKLPAEAPHQEPTLLTPTNNAININRSPIFSWEPVIGATEYEFILARDISLEQRIIDINLISTDYNYTAELEGNNTYFWQVKTTKPFQSQSGSIYSFTTVAIETEQTLIQTMNIPVWLWIVIILIIVALPITLIFIRKNKTSLKS